MAALAALLARDSGEMLWTKETNGCDDGNAAIAPMFVTHPHNLTIYEGQGAHFDCRVEPVGDGSLRAEWYHDGTPLQFGSRTHTINDFGFVVLDIDWTFRRDSGVYKCVLTNKHGSVEWSTKLQVISKKDLESEVEDKASQSTMCMVHMDKAMRKYNAEMFLTEDDVFNVERKQPPRFVSQMPNVTSREMASAKFECQLAPVGDPNMRVDWFFNGQPLIAKTQFMPINDFGYIALNFGWVYKQDSGEYVCKASNQFGTAEIKANLSCGGKTGVIYDSQLPAGMASIEQIHDMEMKVVKEYEPEEHEARTKPCFMTKPEAVRVTEGETARFCCRVTGNPKPRVMWLINGQTIINGSRRKLVFDGMWHLEIPKCNEGGKIEVIARNQCGEAYATTHLKVKKRKDDFRGLLQDKERISCDDFVASSEYKKPVWLVQMEEIKERLAATKQAAKITKECQTNRVKDGQDAEFVCGFAGNPRPEVNWFFKGEKLEEGENCKIKVKDSSTVVRLTNCSPAMEGVYECRISNKLASDKTKASLIVAPSSD